MTSRLADLRDGLGIAVGQVVELDELGESEDCVHRCPQLVTHVRQERGLGVIRPLGVVAGLDQLEVGVTEVPCAVLDDCLEPRPAALEVQHDHPRRQRQCAGDHQLERTPPRLPPSVDSTQRELPRAVLDRYLDGYRVGELAIAPEGHEPVLVAIQRGDLVPVAVIGHLVDSARLEEVVQVDQHRREAPEIGIEARDVPCVREVDRLAADHGDAPLHELEGTGERELTRLDGDERFRGAIRIAQQLVSDRGLVALDRVDVPHDAVRRQLQVGDARHQLPHAVGELGEPVDLAAVELNEGGERDRRIECPVELPLQRDCFGSGPPDRGAAGRVPVLAVVHGEDGE